MKAFSGYRSPSAAPESENEDEKASEMPASRGRGDWKGKQAPPEKGRLQRRGETAAQSQAAATPTAAGHNNLISEAASFVSGPDKASLKAGSRRSHSTSRDNTVFPAGDSRNDDADALNEVRNDMMVNWLYEQQNRKQYIMGDDHFEGVVLKKSRGNFTCCPPKMAAIPDSLFAVVSQMNVRCAMTVNTPVVQSLLGSICAKSNMEYVPLPNGLQVQILPTMADLPRGQRHHFAAFIEDRRLLVVWDDDPENILGRIKDLEARFIDIIWGSGAYQEGDDDTTVDDEKKKSKLGAQELGPGELEEGQPKEHRPVQLQSATMVALTMVLSITCIGLGWRALAFQCTVDGTYLRLALIAAGPVQFVLSIVGDPDYLSFPNLPIHAQRRCANATLASSSSKPSSAICSRCLGRPRT